MGTFLYSFLERHRTDRVRNSSPVLSWCTRCYPRIRHHQRRQLQRRENLARRCDPFPRFLCTLLTNAASRTPPQHVARSHHSRRRLERGSRARQTSSRPRNGSSIDSKLGTRSEDCSESHRILLPLSQSAFDELDDTRSVESTEIKDAQYATGHDDVCFDYHAFSDRFHQLEGADETHFHDFDPVLRLDLIDPPTDYRLSSSVDRNDTLFVEVIALPRRTRIGELKCGRIGNGTKSEGD